MNKAARFWYRVTGRSGMIEKQLDTQVAHALNNLDEVNRRYGWLSSGPDHKLSHLLENCSPEINMNRLPSPRQWVKLSRALYEHLSIFERAINIHASLVGRPTLPEGLEVSDRIRTAADEFIRDCPILTEYTADFPDVKGMSHAVRALVIDTLKDGTSFAQDRFFAGEDGPTEEYAGLMLFDSDHFDYAPMRGKANQYGLTYLDSQYPQTNEEGEYMESPFFHVLKLETNRNALWGVPLIRGGKILADLLVTMLIAIENQTKRFANPPSFNLVQQEDLSMFDKSKNPEAAKIFAESVKKLRANIEEAMKAMHQGKAAEVIQSMPGTIKLFSKVFGEGFTNMIDPDMLWRVSILFANTLGVPPALLGIKTSGGGIASDEFKFAYKLLQARISDLREMLRPVVLQVLKNYLYSLRFNPAEVELLDIEFKGLSMLSEQERATLEKTEAETLEIYVNMYNELRLVDIDEARAFAAEHGLFDME